MSRRPAVDADQLRRDLLDQARAVIAQDGVDGLTMRALAARAGTAVGLSYKAFASRDDLLWELTLDALQKLASQLDDWAATTDGDLAERMMEFLDIHQVSLAPELVEHITRGPRGKELFRAAADAGDIRSWASTMADFLSARQRAGSIRADANIDAFAFLVTAAMHHVLVTKEPFHAPDRPTLTRYLAAVTAGISTTATNPPKAIAE
jgi:AcrR family transcriptional regulator